MAAKLKSRFEELDVSINEKTPRRNSFECVLISEDGKENVIWSGISKGPPRKFKFPQEDDIEKLLNMIEDAIDK